MKEKVPTQYTQLPNVELDARDTSCELVVPYIAPTDWYKINNSGSLDTFGWGEIVLKVLSPL